MTLQHRPLRSLRVRLLFYGATVAAASLVVLVAVLARGTVVEVRESSLTQLSAPAAGPFAGSDSVALAARDSVEEMLRLAEGQGDSTAPVAELLERIERDLGREVLLVDPQGEILGASTGAGESVLPVFSVEALADDTFRLSRSRVVDGREVLDEVILRAPAGALFSADGRRVGTLLVLPQEPAHRGAPAAGSGARGTTGPDLVRALGRWLAVALLAVAVVATPLGLVLARRLARPIEALTLAAQRLRSGRLGERVVLGEDVAGTAEIAGLVTAFNSMAQDLEHAEEARRRLVADVAHELRTPLARLRSQVEALGEGILPLDRAALGAIENDVLGLGRLVDDLQDLALADTRSLRLLPTEVELGELVVRAVRAHEREAHAMGISVVVEPVAGEAASERGARTLEIRADRGRIEQVVGNLLSNALAWARSPGGRVVVRLASAVRNGRAGATIVVEDDGPGIAAEDIDRVFERFFRVDPSRVRGKDATSGMGLGLAIVRALARAHGGEAWAEPGASDGPPRGARLSVFLPASGPAEDDGSRIAGHKLTGS